MIKQTIKYEDLDGNPIVETHYFHMNKAELIELEMTSTSKSWLKEIEAAIAAEDGKRLMAEFKSILLKSYGRKSEDGKRFLKKQEWTEEFEGSEAYSEIFMGLVTDPDKAAAFVNGIIPKSLHEEMAKQSQ